MDNARLVADDELLLVGVQTHAVDGLVGLEKEKNNVLISISLQSLTWYIRWHARLRILRSQILAEQSSPPEYIHRPSSWNPTVITFLLMPP